MAYLHLIQTGRFGDKVKIDGLLSSSRYLNRRLLNYSQRFTSDSDYIFFTHPCGAKNPV